MRKAISLAALVAAFASVDAFQVRMSLEKYKSELAETAKKIAAPGMCTCGVGVGVGLGVDVGWGGRE